MKTIVDAIPVREIPSKSSPDRAGRVTRSCTVSATTRKRLEMQGFVGYESCALAEFRPWLRLTTGICAAWAGLATLSGAPIAFWALVPFALLGAVLPHHPFDAIYNYVIRPRLGTHPIPPSPAPRRFACGVAVAWLTLAGLALQTGLSPAGYTLGASMALIASVTTTTDFCIPSFTYQRVGRAVRRLSARMGRDRG